MTITITITKNAPQPNRQRVTFGASGHRSLSDGNTAEEKEEKEHSELDDLAYLFEQRLCSL